MKIDAIPKVQSPIRRFIARQIDLAIYSSAVSMLMMLCNVNIERGGRLLSLVISLLAMALMIAIEPILLHFLGTTPGKYIFGLYVVDIDGSKIDYLDALSRTCNVCFYGLGFNVPVISLYRLWKSYKACDECEELPWEYESELLQKRPAVFKSILAFVLSVVLVFLLVYIGLFSVEMPKHRGEISVEQFAENYNKFAAYLGDGNFPVLNPDGTWKKYDSHIYNGYIVDTDSYTQKWGFPDFVYKTDDKGLYEISLHYNTSASFPPDLREQLFICTASFACTVKEYSLRSENRQVLNLVMENPFNSFSYSEDGISVDCKYDYEGYDRKITIYGLLWPEEGKEQRFDMEFVIRKDR